MASIVTCTCVDVSGAKETAMITALRFPIVGRLATIAATVLALLQLDAGSTVPAAWADCNRAPDAQASFESVNYSGHFIRHRNSLGALTTVDGDLDRKDATFIMRPGLVAGVFRSVSFESVNFPNHFLRHENYRIKLSPRQDTDLFRQDATFVQS